MKFCCGVIVAIALGFGVVSARAAMNSTEQDRLRAAANVLTSLSNTPDADVPSYVWERARCVVVIPSVKKAAFIFGGEYGKGVATCRNGSDWSAPAFMQLEKGSWGAQIGAEEIDLVLMVMNDQGMNKLLEDKVTLGVGASVSAGPVGRTARATTDLQLSAELLSYSRSNGLFAGVDLSGGVLGPDHDANGDLYGPNATARQILVDHAFSIPLAAVPFLSAVKRGASEQAAFN